MNDELTTIHEPFGPLSPDHAIPAMSVAPEDLQVGDVLVDYETTVRANPQRINSHKIAVETTGGRYTFPDSRTLQVSR